jgi:exodeoxyribonuclease-1
MLRQMFYQNLQPNIFATQFHNNTRLDVMKMVFAVHAEAPKILKWPLNDKGKVTFKLDQLAPLNGFHAHNAHDALGDVEATIFIVDVIKTQRPDLYQKLVQARDKERNLQLLKSFKPVDVTLRFGGNAPKTYTGCFCGLPRNNKNIVGFFDLNQSDPMDLIHGTDQDILTAMTESPQRIRSFRLNQADTIRPASVTSHEYNHICAVIKGNEEFQAMVSEHLDNKYVNEEDIELRIEEKIFSGFYSYQDKELLQSFQSSTWSERLALLTEAQDDRIRQLGRRLVAFNASHLLEDKYQKIAQEYVAEKWSAIEPNVKWTTIASVTSQLAQLETEGFDDKLLDEMKIFYRNRVKAQGCSVDF